MQAVALHRDVLVVSSALLRVNCVVVREGDDAFAIDSPVLPDELAALPELLERARFPPPVGLLATHGDWDHLLGRLAFAQLALGVSESTASRLAAEPGAVQRELRSFDEELGIDRPAPLALGSVQALPVPGRCAIGQAELELHPVAGHTADGMAVAIPWAKVLVAGDYLSPVEIPVLHDAGGGIDVYAATLEGLRGPVAASEHVVPGHGPAIAAQHALAILDEDLAYLQRLRTGALAELPPGRRSRQQRTLHESNVAAVGAATSR